MKTRERRVDYSQRFLKLFAKAPKQIRLIAVDQLDLFDDDPFHPSLRNHQLTGRFSQYHSIDITGDWRALYKEEKSGVIIFEFIGTHEQLYG